MGHKNLITFLIVLALLPGVLPAHAQNAQPVVYVVARANPAGSFDLYRLAPDAAESIRLDTEGLAYSDMQLSDDGAWLFYFKQIDATTRQLWTAKFDGSMARGLGEPFTLALAASYAISPTSDHALLTVFDPAEAQPTRRLIVVQSGAHTPAPEAAVVHFSSDGQFLQYGYTSEGVRPRWTAARIGVTPGAVEEVIFRDTVDAASAAVDVVPLPASDLFVVFVALDDSNERFMYLVETNGSLTQLRHSDAAFDRFEYVTTWDVNGERYVIYRETPGGDLAAVNLVTGEQRSLAEGDAVFLDASADLSQIIYREVVPPDAEGAARIHAVFYKDSAGDAVEIVRDYTVDGHLIDDRYAGFYNRADDSPTGWDSYRVWDVQAGEPVLLFQNVDATTRLFANDKNALLVLIRRDRDDPALRLVIYNGGNMDEIMTIEVLNPGDATLYPRDGLLTFIAHESPDHVFLLDLTRDSLIPYKLTEGAQVWRLVLDAGR